ncbi:MAG: type IX secretion system membrane protein PorP/SprF [Bacteroidales bacterium]|nr:type IX secretion system membrane protein PorP/SprF [Bacteroidales bacterium]
MALMLVVEAYSQAQIEGQYTHFMFNRLSYNPAYAGSSGNISATVLYRSQWLGFDLQAPVAGGEAGSAPTDMLFSVDLPVRWLHGGLGLNFTSEKLGYHSNNVIELDYAFRLYWGAGTLSAAVGAELQSCQFKTTNLLGMSDLSGDPANPVATSSDPLLTGGELSDFLIDVATGLYYQVPGIYYVGLSVKNLLGAKSDQLNLTNARTLYLMGGYEYTFPYNPSLKFKPSALVKTADFSAIQADVACLLDYENTLWGGVGYRWGDAFTLMAGLNFLKIMQVGVAYDLTTSKLGFGGGRSLGSVEVYMNLAFQINVNKKNPTVSRNTLYLR